MQRHDPPVFQEKPNYAGVELADMPHFKKTVAKRFGQRLTMILAIAKLGQTAITAAKSSGSVTFKSSKKSCIGQAPDSVS
jgi:hypothetical protein